MGEIRGLEELLQWPPAVLYKSQHHRHPSARRTNGEVGRCDFGLNSHRELERGAKVWTAAWNIKRGATCTWHSMACWEGRPTRSWKGVPKMPQTSNMVAHLNKIATIEAWVGVLYGAPHYSKNMDIENDEYDRPLSGYESQKCSSPPLEHIPLVQIQCKHGPQRNRHQFPELQFAETLTPKCPKPFFEVRVGHYS